MNIVNEFMMNFFLKRKRIRIGNHDLLLDLSNPHEKQYYKSIKNDDFIISKSLIKDGFKVLDLGANIGFTSLLYLQFGASEVYAFEPVSNLAKRIRGIKSNKIKVFNYALSDYDGESEIYLSSAHNQGHSLNDNWPERFGSVFINNKKEKVKVGMLDSLLTKEVFDFIKIDVEGTEEKTIIGGDKFFNRNKEAIVQIEIYDWQFSRTHSLLSQYYKYTYVPVIINNELKNFKDLYTHANMNEIKFAGPPNYIYSNFKINI